MLYFLFGIAWLATCLMIGYYIRCKNANKPRVGIVAMLISYVFGLGILVFAITH